MGNCLKCFNTNNSNDNAVSTQRIQISEKISQDSRFEELLQTTNLNNKTNHYDSNNFNKMPLVINGNSSSSLIDDKTTNQSVKESQLTDNAINKLFEEYKDKDEDAILSEGIERLCQDLQYSPDEFPILVLAFCLDAKQMCKFTKQEFIYGLRNLNASTINELRLRIIQIVEKLQSDDDLFKQLYRFTFHFGLDEGARILNLDMAMSLWKLVYYVHTPDNNLLERWLSFLSKENIRGIQRDTWLMFQNFAECFDINSYDSDEAWPSLFDDFVEYEIIRLKIFDQNIDKEVEQESNNNNNVL
ncbi:DCN1-like protein 3 isoform X2 [Chironomus tepperi]|uniref:DCN1-like protein 3 isoform X2 n=1 Tax=Chironomus tepperi TaxID=113505 RepID=UPI00391F06C7